MTKEMIKQAFKTAKEALQKYSIEKDIATYIKYQFDELFQPYWYLSIIIIKKIKTFRNILLKH